MNWKNTIAKIQEVGALTQPQVAAIVGCGQATISDIFNEKTKDPRHSLGQSILALHERLKAEKSVTREAEAWMFTTHQQVVDACREINRERNKKAAVLDKEREAQMLALQEQCFALGHVFTYSDDRFQLYQTGRRCVFCGAPEPVAHAEQGA